MRKFRLIKTLFISIVLIFFQSCHRQKKVSSEYSIVLEVVLKQSDSIHTYYTTNGSINFNENQSFWTTFNGSSKNQKIKIIFPNDTIPSQIRFDFGKNRKLEEIVLNKITLAQKDKQIVIKGKEIYYYFRVDESNTILDKELGILKKIDTSQTNGPSLYPNGDFLKNKLKEIKN